MATPCTRSGTVRRGSDGLPAGSPVPARLNVEALKHLGNALRALGRLPEAIACFYEEGLRHAPDHALLHMAGPWSGCRWAISPGLARVRLAARGQGTLHPSPARSGLDGGRLDGRTIVVAAEQGLGDTIQFIRYSPLVARAAAGGRRVACRARLPDPWPPARASIR